jgi:hypothetical protein
MSSSTPSVFPDLPSEQRTVYWIATYQALAARRAGYDHLMWQTPVLSMTAQSFLFTISLGPETPAIHRVASAFLSLITGLISIQLMAKHRHHEELDSRLLEAMENGEALQFRLGPSHAIVSHSGGDGRLYFLKRLKESQAPGIREPQPAPVASLVRPIVRWSSYRLWILGLWMYVLVAGGVLGGSLWSLLLERTSR